MNNFFSRDGNLKKKGKTFEKYVLSHEWECNIQPRIVLKLKAKICVNQKTIVLKNMLLCLNLG